MSKLLPVHERPYRPGVGIVLFNPQGLVWVGRRNDVAQEAWQFPQGGIDKGEDPLQAALREMEEEIGTNKAELLGQSSDWIAYDLPEDLVDRAWGGKYRGQKQMWYAFRFLGRDADIVIETKHPEFAEWRWMALAEVPGKIVEFKRGLYDRVTAEFLPLAATF
jgi:putative (di)nucleoside polyphosphate hydrolase